MIIPSDVAERNRNRYLKTPGQKKNAEKTGDGSLS